MMQHHLLIQARSRPEVLERILRVVRHRGFQVCGLNLVSVPDAEQIHLHLMVASQRPVDLLSTQLIKLLDVNQVDIQQPTSPQIRT